MGSVVKSIGKAIKKVGKGIKKIVKKIGPALLVAAAVYTGVAFYGAGGMAGGIGSLTPTNFMAGIKKFGSFLMPQATGATGATGAGIGTAQSLATGMTGSGWSGATSAAITGPETMAAMNTATTVSDWVGLNNAAGLTTAQALENMSKRSLFKWGIEAGLGLFDTSEEDLRAHEKELLQMRLDADKAAQAKQYAYGAPMTEDQQAWLAQNPNWMSTHPSVAGPQSYSSQYNIHKQNIGQPTFGRQSTRQYETPAPGAVSLNQPGLITQAAKQKALV